LAVDFRPHTLVGAKETFYEGKEPSFTTYPREIGELMSNKKPDAFFVFDMLTPVASYETTSLVEPTDVSGAEAAEVGRKSHRAH
jgi:hypothetical protein